MLVERAHAAYVAGEVSFGDEVGQHRLVSERRVAIQQRAGADAWLDQIRRQYEITEPEGWKQHFAEGSEVDRAARKVEALESGDGAAGVAELAVVIVLDDPGAGAPHPFE